ncbi:MAG: hypothetical protein ACLTSX_01725 [Collinsella sp.]
MPSQSRLHAIISREDAEDLIDSYADLAVDSFTERNSALEETHFKQQLKLGAPETVRVAKTMRRRIARSGSPWQETEQLLFPHAQGGAPPHHRRSSAVALRKPTEAL